MKPFSPAPALAYPGLGMLFATAACAPSEALDIERTGEVWRLLTGQLIHWTPRMAAFDVGMLLGLGTWLETQGDRLARRAAALVLGAGLSALAVSTCFRRISSVVPGRLGPGFGALCPGRESASRKIPILGSAPWGLRRVALFLGKGGFRSSQRGRRSSLDPCPRESVSFLSSICWVGSADWWERKRNSGTKKERVSAQLRDPLEDEFKTLIRESQALSSRMARKPTLVPTLGAHPWWSPSPERRLRREILLSARGSR